LSQALMKGSEIEAVKAASAPAYPVRTRECGQLEMAAVSRTSPST